ncbi:MAG: hypothetical protein K5872_13820 [Rhizobiaceae bacterium]|nr:hypothetical protein [Rhizobiaceae bacterium]MCV0407298.1 hypothetical protein [Rhizobiaceae bacterium]
MNRILIASATLLAFAGVAAAQQAPVLVGNYSANVLDAYNGTVTEGVDFAGTAAIGADRVAFSQDAQARSDLPTIWNDNYSGK